MAEQIKQLVSDREEMTKSLLREVEEKNKLKSESLLLGEELQKLRQLKVEPKKEHFGTMNNSIERKMIRAPIDPLKQNEYKTYLKSSKVVSSQHSCSNRKINKNSTIVQNLKYATSALSEKAGPHSNRNQTYEKLTSREINPNFSFDKTPTKFIPKV